MWGVVRGRLVAYNLVPEHGWLAPAIVSHFTQHGNHVAELIKHMLTCAPAPTPNPPAPARPPASSLARLLARPSARSLVRSLTRPLADSLFTCSSFLPFRGRLFGFSEQGCARSQLCIAQGSNTGQNGGCAGFELRSLIPLCMRLGLRDTHPTVG